MKIRFRWQPLLLMVCVGCSDGAATVSGLVTLDGKPIECNEQMYGTVSFYRESGGGAPAVGLIDESGHYSVKTGATLGLEPGKYAIGISVKQIGVPANTGDLPTAKPITPARYASAVSSGLREEVVPGDNTFDFALTSQAAP